MGQLVKRFETLATSDPSKRMDRATCRRFLVARDGDFDAATGMLRAYAKWRKRVRPSEIAAADVPTEVAARKAFAHGVDRAQRGVIWAFAARHDKAHRDISTTMKYITFCMEGGIRIAEAHGTETVCLVLDLTGFSMKTMDYRLWKRLTAMLNSYYPERLGQVLICDAPALFTGFWCVAKLWIGAATVQKVHFVSLPSLSQHIDPAMLPPEMAAPFPELLPNRTC